ncbi:group II intron reverse transcriptase/maturase [Anaerospora hongkongensis]|nr:group II intron reverse transcriptase/maturase [Anaerospora hongkongensis]
MTACKKSFKKSKLRYNEYYDTQPTFDELYERSQNGQCFKNLIPIIESENNILLAYRKIKRNTGSNTSGTNGHTIRNIMNATNEDIVRYFQKRLRNYSPHSVRRTEIDKGNGKKRPLGIPTIEDRILQQCILQVLEPICEAKFYPYSFGFRPNRSAHHAIARAYHLVNINKMYYVVDIDIKGFFDNVNHGKLLKQMWTLGIRDKNLICIIGKMLKAEVKGKGIPKVGTPQGGVLSPLLSNIVLNELDWWIDSQWLSMKTRHAYQNCCSHSKALRTTTLKEMYIVRYADDFKIFCRSYNHAIKIFAAVEAWIKERLGLEISPEKSKITNLRREYTEFLGIKIKAVPKRKTHVIESRLTDKAKKKCVERLKTAIHRIEENSSAQNVSNYNATVLGLQNYYAIASSVSKDFREIAFVVNRCLYNRLKHHLKRKGIKSRAFLKFYGKYNQRTYSIGAITLFPVQCISTRPPLNFKQETCDFTVAGRALIHQKLKRANMAIVRYLMRNPVQGESVEYNDNRISLYIGQAGLCRITKAILQIGQMEAHHIQLRATGGTDQYDNLIFITRDVHHLIHTTSAETIQKYLDIVKPNAEELKSINKCRLQAGNHMI